MAQDDEFKKGDNVRVSDPDNPFYNWTGTVKARLTGPEVDNRRPHRYYEVEFVPNTTHLVSFETVRTTLALTFREHRLTRA